MSVCKSILIRWTLDMQSSIHHCSISFIFRACQREKILPHRRTLSTKQYSESGLRGRPLKIWQGRRAFSTLIFPGNPFCTTLVPIFLELVWHATFMSGWLWIILYEWKSHVWSGPPRTKPNLSYPLLRSQIHVLFRFTKYDRLPVLALHKPMK